MTPPYLTTQDGELVPHPCSYGHCAEAATALVRDDAPWWPTFKHGAGYVCDKHAREAIRGGCIRVTC